MIYLLESRRPDGKYFCAVNWQQGKEEKVFSLVADSEESRNSFFKKKTKEALVNTVKSYLSQREFAFSRTTVVSIEKRQALSFAQVQLAQIGSLRGLALYQRIYQSRKHLITIMPPESSPFQSWIKTINELISFCQTQISTNHGTSN